MVGSEAAPAVGRRSHARRAIVAIFLLSGAAGLIYGIVMSIQQFEMLTGTAAGVVGHLYWAIPIAAVVGLVVGVVRLSQGADLERGFGEETAPADDATSAGLATAEPASEPT